MPTPVKSESKEEFVARYMASDEVKNNGKDQKQNLAIAYSVYDHKDKSYPNKEGFDNAMEALVSKRVKAVPSDDSDGEPRQGGIEEKPHDFMLGMDEEKKNYGYDVGEMNMEEKKVVVKKIKNCLTMAKYNGHNEIAESAQSLLDYVSKEMPTFLDYVSKSKKEKPLKKKLERVFSIIKEKDLIKTLNKEAKEDEHTGFWAFATVEKEDADGDVIMVDGIRHKELDGENHQYLPLLASHYKKLPDGKLPIIGGIDKTLKTKLGEDNAFAFHAKWALNEKGEPITDLTREYKEMYQNGFLNSVSVGMDPDENVEPMMRKSGGHTYPATILHEVSMVSLGSNSGAVGITRSEESEEADNKMDQKVLDFLMEMKKWMEEKFDYMESCLTEMADEEVEEKHKEKKEEKPKEEEKNEAEEKKKVEEKAQKQAALVKSFADMLDGFVK